jgi:hypothetical protein
MIPPFRAPTGPSRVRGIVGARLDTVPGEREGYPVPAALWAFGEDFERRVILDGSDADVAKVAEALFCTATRSKLIVFQHGAKHDLRLIAQRWGLALDRLGFAVEMMVNDGNLRALVIKRGRHRWYLVDWQSVTGRPATELADYIPKMTPDAVLRSNPATGVYLAVSHVQWFLRTHFGVGLGVTISSTAVRACARSTAPELWKWKPQPILVSLCRVGYGFRGGMVNGRRYRGNAVLVDLNRAYTAALTGSLPLRSALGRCVLEGRERPGMYLCRVIGQGARAIYCGQWNASCGRFDLGWHRGKPGGSFVTVLATAEFSGIRAAGYEVVPTIGMVFTRVFDFKPYVDRIARAVEKYGPQSPLGRLTKLLGNAVYGKFAAGFERRTVRLSNGRPGRDWYVWVDSDGWPVEHVWEQTKVGYQWSQQVDIAAVVTARVRSWMYEAEASIRAHGGSVLGMQTDCLILDRSPPDGMALHSWHFGAWKVVTEDSAGVVVGPNCYSIGEQTVAPDHPNPTRQDVVSLFENQGVETLATKRGTPRPDAPLYVTMTKRINSPD